MTLVQQKKLFNLKNNICLTHKEIFDEFIQIYLIKMFTDKDNFY